MYRLEWNIPGRNITFVLLSDCRWADKEDPKGLPYWHTFRTKSGAAEFKRSVVQTVAGSGHSDMARAFLETAVVVPVR